MPIRKPEDYIRRQLKHVSKISGNETEIKQNHGEYR